MNTVIRILFTLGGLLVMGLILWFSITLLGVLIIGGGLLVLFFALRQFLLEKGILNPTPGTPMTPPEGNVKVTIIETEFTRVDDASSKAPEQPKLD